VSKETYYSVERDLEVIRQLRLIRLFEGELVRHWNRTVTVDRCL